MTTMTTFQKNSSNEHGISLCIPFVFKHITKEKVFAVIRAQRIGHIERIDIVNKGEKHNRVYIHFARSRWGNPANIRTSMDVLLNLQSGIPWIIPYSRYGYWKIWISESVKPEQTDVVNSAPRVKRKEKLDLSEPTVLDTDKEENTILDPLVLTRQTAVRFDDDELWDSIVEEYEDDFSSTTTNLNLNDPIQARIASAMR